MIFLLKFRFYYSEFRNLMVNNEYNLSHYLPDFINVFQSAGDLMRVKLKQPRYFINKVCQPLWWDPVCSQAKSTKQGALRKFRTTNSCEDFTSYKIQRSRFKAMCKLKKRKFEKEKRSELIDSRKNPKLFWQNIKGSFCTKPACNNEINSNDWFKYFKILFDSSASQANLDEGIFLEI